MFFSSLENIENICHYLSRYKNLDSKAKQILILYVRDSVLPSEMYWIIFLGGSGPHLSVIREYSWLCTHLVLMVPSGVLGSNWGQLKLKANVLFLYYLSGNFFLCLFVFWNTPCGVQGLFLTLNSEIIPGRLWMPGIKIWSTVYIIGFPIMLPLW